MVLLELELCGRELAGGKGEKTEKEKEWKKYIVPCEF
jgi:hypothetical protein